MLSRRAVNGHVLPPPRPTLWAIWYALAYLGLPLIGVLALVDLLLWLLFTRVLGRCYGVLCLLG